jgi:hypothetical protein
MNSALPAWAKAGVVGVICFITLFLLGAVPGVRSPIDRILEAVQLHDAHTKDMMDVLRQICENGAKDRFAYARCWGEKQR